MDRVRRASLPSPRLPPPSPALPGGSGRQDPPVKRDSGRLARVVLAGQTFGGRGGIAMRERNYAWMHGEPLADSGSPEGEIASLSQPGLHRDFREISELRGLSAPWNESSRPSPPGLAPLVKNVDSTRYPGDKSRISWFYMALQAQRRKINKR